LGKFPAKIFLRSKISGSKKSDREKNRTKKSGPQKFLAKKIPGPKKSGSHGFIGKDDLSHRFLWKPL
jgi:hypothetical protein